MTLNVTLNFLLTKLNALCVKDGYHAHRIQC